MQWWQWVVGVLEFVATFLPTWHLVGRRQRQKLTPAPKPKTKPVEPPRIQHEMERSIKEGRLRLRNESYRSTVIDYVRNTYHPFDRCSCSTCLRSRRRQAALDAWEKNRLDWETPIKDRFEGRLFL